MILGSCLLTLPSHAQNKNKIVVVAGKPMTSIDSATVRQLFFSGLREKAIENNTLAFEYFDRVVQIDPQNDASLYELAIIKKAKNNCRCICWCFLVEVRFHMWRHKAFLA